MSLLDSRIGFIQGRLSSIIDGKIQVFPWQSWRDEFSIAKSLGFSLMEWTLDQERLHDNPLMTEVGRKEIRKLCEDNSIQIPSLTGDCFMQAPFWKFDGTARVELEKEFAAVAKSCAEAGILIMVVPLVDNGRIESMDQENELVQYLESQERYFLLHKIKIVFESDFTPNELARFIKRLNPNVFGINYDIGNSAALGFDPKEEFSKYGERVMNIHIKDRVLGGTTVPLGSGNANFNVVFTELSRINYRGNYILQTARAQDDSHVAVLSKYRDQTIEWISRYAS